MEKFWNVNNLLEVEFLQHFLRWENSRGPQEKHSRAANRFFWPQPNLRGENFGGHCARIGLVRRTVARKFSIAWLGFAFLRGSFGLCGGLDTPKIDKISTDNSVSCFNLGGLELCLGGLSPQKSPPWRRDCLFGQCHSLYNRSTAIAYLLLQGDCDRNHHCFATPAVIIDWKSRLVTGGSVFEYSSECLNTSFIGTGDSCIVTLTSIFYFWNCQEAMARS